MSRSLRFANLLASELRGGSIEMVRARYYRVTGKLDIGVDFASVEIWVPWLFKKVKRGPPPVWCHEEWIRPGVDWHNLGEAGLCWVLPEEWRDAMNWKGKPVRAIMEEGRELFLRNTRSLITRHWVANAEDIDEWQDDWEAWSHSGKGREEYVGDH